jgi:hypothetical protein
VAGWSREQWNSLPKGLSLRVVRINFEINGFCVHQNGEVVNLLGKNLQKNVKKS